MRDVYLVGAGGFGREVYYLAQSCSGYGSDFQIAGFFDDNAQALDPYDGYPPILGSIADLQAESQKWLFVAIGENSGRRAVVTKLLGSGHKFITLIHETARIARSANYGEGCLIGPIVSLGADAGVGAFTLLQTGAIVGHDAELGQFCRLDNYGVIVAGADVKDECTIHSGAIVNGGVVIESGATVGAASFVIRRVGASKTVCGNPAREI